MAVDMTVTGTVNALKEMYLARGGNAEDVENITRTDQMILALAALYDAAEAANEAAGDEATGDENNG